MIVYIDGMDFRRTGIGRVLESLISGFAESEKVSGIQTIIPRSKAEEFRNAYGNHPKIEVRFADFEPFSLQDFLLKQRMIDRFPPGADVHFYPNMNVPLFPRGKVVCTVNDIIMMTAESSWSPVKKWLFRILTARAVSRAQGVVCISDFTRREVERVFGKNKALSRVIHPCIGYDFLHADTRNYREKPLVAGDYVLHVGIRVGHKNHAGLIQGWMEARKTFPDLKLAIAGKRLWDDDVDRLRRDYRIGDELVEFREATDEDVKNLYANAKAFVFPSLVEGFGIPPLEAMAMGTPVICSDIPVLREVNGDAAVYVDPKSPGSISEGIIAVLSERSLRERLTTAGKARLALFTRKRMTEEYLFFLELVCRTL